MHIKEKVAVITGAASGIGRAICLDLARRGLKAVAVVDMTDSVGEAVKEINQEAGREVAYAFQGNVTNDAFRKDVFEQMRDRFEPISICVPAAGITRDALAVRISKQTGKAEIYPVDTFRQVVDVNLIAPIYWALEMVGHLAEERKNRQAGRWTPDEGIQGVVIFIGSVSSQGIKGQIAYSSTKSGLEGAAAALMKEVIFHGVRCGVIHPGFTDTPMVQALGEEYIKKHILPDTQLGRLIRPDEIADAICFMVNNAAVSGELWADAGWHPSPA